MKKTVLFLSLATILLLSGCKQEFLFKIATPSNNGRVLLGKDLPVIVDVIDFKGSIETIGVYIAPSGSDALSPIGSINVYSSSETSFRFDIPASLLTLGSFTITATLNTNKGFYHTSVLINVVENIIYPEKESPDFVTFANGSFPDSWKTYSWDISYERGYDDYYSLRSANYPALVFATKTVDTLAYIQFYTTGGEVSLYIDDVKRNAYSSEPDGEWTQWIYALEKGKHRFKWEANGSHTYLDAIRFNYFILPN